MPFPTETQSAKIIRIGRSPDSNVVLDFPIISWEHARILYVNGEYILEDLNSRNGTALNHIQNKISRTVVQPYDNVYFGSLKVPVSRLLAEQGTAIGSAAYEQVALKEEAFVLGRDPQCDQPLDDPLVSWHHARITKSGTRIFVEDLSSLNGTFVDGVPVSGKVEAKAGQEIELGKFHFRVLEGGQLERREYHGNVSIEAAAITVNAPNGTRLLDPISFTVYPSEMVALMGPAGAGKTTLLKALNGYSPPASGQVLFNSSDLYKSYDLFRLQMGYVPQDDIVHSQLTVREALYFSTKLRTDLTDAEIEQRIDSILEQLGILDKKNTLIGSPEQKVLSGGQRKRVNIAMELITDTPVLFLDEPTSGLSSYDAEGVVDLLKRFAGEGKTIITTIHQPSVVVYRKFDNLIMISRDRGGCGALAYFGPAYPESIEFFNNSHKEEKTESAKSTKDLSPEMLLTGLAGAKTSEWCERFQQSKYYKLFVEGRAGKAAGNREQSTASRRFNFTQWFTLLRRNLILKMRDRAQLMITLLQAPLFAALIVLVFSGLKEPPDIHSLVDAAPTSATAGSLQTAVKAFSELGASIAGIEFLMVVAAIWFGCNNAARDIVGEWTVYQRERMVNLKLPSYVFAKFTVLAALCTFQCLVLLGIVYFACGLKGSFVQAAGLLVLSSLVGASLGLAISARSPTTETAIALLPVVLLPIIALGGGIRAVYKMPGVTQWISYAVPSKWAFERNVVDEARGHVCGYLPGLQKWDACPSGGHGVDAATMQMPEAVQTNDGQKEPAPLNHGRSLRHSYARSAVALGGMLVVLLLSTLAFLKMRDIL
ncbi:ATP-binding cassette domain-containing protein [Acidobacterium sp. S8]|uniref:ATP-binding cassette domain-containing protein n=1 Tax=Acidobacterium sp. S8 TaxID=1641854 RepID=UPI00131CAD45|nr:ATP-binding cassette domain-containing protein [Acidobacterium sp. S8]